MSLGRREKSAGITWKKKGRDIARLSSFLPSAAQDEVAADDEDQGDDARTQGRTCAGKRPATRTTDRLTTTGAASLTSGSTRPARGSRQTTHTDRSRGTVSTPASG